MSIRFLKMPEVLSIRGRGRTATLTDIEKGLFVPPVRLGRNSIGWAEHEVQAVNLAILAGATESDLRGLVRQLIADRAQLILQDSSGIALDQFRQDRSPTIPAR